MTRIPYFASALIAFAACATEGQRRDTGACPTGEVCSPATPDGLSFVGATFGDDWLVLDPALKITAVGGTQDVTINGIGSLPFSIAISTGALTADAPIGAALRLHGVAAGDPLLRIVDPATRALYDRVTIHAAAIAQISITPATDQLVDQSERVALLRGSGVDLVARLTDAAGNRLVDQRMTIAGASTRASWDTVHIASVPATEVALTITAGDRPALVATLPVVEGIDTLIAATPLTTEPPAAGDSVLVCFDGHAAGATVIGLTFSLSATGADTTAPVFGNCVSVTRATAGRVTVHAETEGLQASRDVDFGAPSTARRASRVRTGAELIAQRFPAHDVTLGERAAIAEDASIEE
ncbi:MAG: hypothetical protein K8W52_19470 [Deltaproteobacteria bacterium]|nr:hypothetical protein [Deltaproteobacteria bacterium]